MDSSGNQKDVEQGVFIEALNIEGWLAASQLKWYQKWSSCSPVPSHDSSDQSYSQF